MATYLPQEGKGAGDIAEDARDRLREIDVLGDKRIKPENADDARKRRCARRIRHAGIVMVWTICWIRLNLLLTPQKNIRI